MEQLNEKTVTEYIERTDLRKTILGNGELKATLISEGNVNLIFRVENAKMGSL